MNEIVKYKNELNELNFYNLSAQDSNIFMVLCSKMRDKGTEKVTFTYQEIRELAKIKIHSNDDFINALKRMNKRLSEVNCTIETETDIDSFNLFPTFRISKLNQTLTVSINPDFKYLLNDITNNFTRFELKEFVSLKSKYTKSLYRILKQYRSTGARYMDIKDIREKLDVPEKYENRRIMNLIIKPSIDDLRELDSFKDLKCIAKRAEHGRNVIGYTFYFNKEIIADTKTGTKRKTQNKKNDFNNIPKSDYGDINELENQILSN